MSEVTRGSGRPPLIGLLVAGLAASAALAGDVRLAPPAPADDRRLASSSSPCPGPPAAELWANTSDPKAVTDVALPKLDQLKKGRSSKEVACLDVVAARGLLKVGLAAEAIERLKAARNPTSVKVRPWIDLLIVEASGAAGVTEAELDKWRVRMWKDAKRLRGKVEAKRFDKLAHLAELRALLKVAPGSEATTAAAKALLTPSRTGSKALALISQALPAGDADGDIARRRLLIEHPEHPAARALEGEDPAALPLDQAARVRRVEELILASRMERALLEVQALPTATDGPIDVPLEVVRVKALVRNDKAADAAAHVKALLDKNQHPDLLESHAWALGKAQRPKDAAAAYRRLMAASTDDPGRRGDACFFAGFLLFEAAHDDDAIAQWDDCRSAPDDAGAEEATAPLAGHDREADAVWYTALGHLTAGRYDQAANLLRRFHDTYPAYDEVWKVYYWRAVALERAGEHLFAKTGFNHIVVRADPQTYYWHLAKKAANKRGNRKGMKVDHDALLKKAARDGKAKRTRLLHHMGFQAAARASLRDRAKQNAGTLGLAQQIGAWDYAYRRNLRVRPRSYVSRASKRAYGWRASYPRPWPTLVEKAATEHGVSADFVYAIMRTESAFDPDITSRVGARGLLQLMPYTARGMAEQLKIPPPAPDAIYRPEVVIPLGVAFLSISNKELGAMALSAAAYNGGPRNVARWMERFGHLPPELFIERIAFKETRNYVKKTAVTTMMYGALEGGPLQLDLPTKPVGKPPKTFTWFDPSNNE